MQVASQQYFIRDGKTREPCLYAFRHVFLHQVARLDGGASDVRSYENILHL